MHKVLVSGYIGSPQIYKFHQKTYHIINNIFIHHRVMSIVFVTNFILSLHES